MSVRIPVEQIRSWRVRRWISTFFVLLSLLSVACTVRLISPYDTVVDQKTTELQAKIVAFGEKMKSTAGTPAGTYEANSDFYADTAGTVSTLKSRAEAVEKNEITVRLIGELETNLSKLAKLHQVGKEKGLREVVAKPAIEALETNCRAIVKLEIAKRRGEEKE